jgi:hypothetical protein
MKTIKIDTKEAQIILIAVSQLKLIHKREIEKGLKNNEDIDYYVKSLLYIEKITERISEKFGREPWLDL